MTTKPNPKRNIKVTIKKPTKPKTPKTKPFNFQITISEIPYNKKTFKYLYGNDAAFLNNTPENTLAIDILGELFKHAICDVIQSKMIFLEKDNIKDTKKLKGRQKLYWDYLNNKIKQFETIQSSIKPI